MQGEPAPLAQRRARVRARPAAAALAAVEQRLAGAVAVELARELAERLGEADGDDGVLGEREPQPEVLRAPRELGVRAAEEEGLVPAQLAGELGAQRAVAAGDVLEEAVGEPLLDPRALVAPAALELVVERVQVEVAADDVRVVVERSDERGEPAGHGDVVGVAERDDLARGRGDAGVARVVEAPALGQGHDAQAGEAVGEGPRHVAAPSLEPSSTTTTSHAPRVVLARERLELVGEVAALVADGHDDAHESRCRHGRRLPRDLVPRRPGDRHPPLPRRRRARVPVRRVRRERAAARAASRRPATASGPSTRRRPTRARARVSRCRASRSTGSASTT